MFREVKIMIQPMLQRQIDKDVCGLRDEYRLLDRVDVIVRGIGRCMSDSSDAVETRHATSGENQSDGQRHCLKDLWNSLVGEWQQTTWLRSPWLRSVTASTENL